MGFRKADHRARVAKALAGGALGIALLLLSISPAGPARAGIEESPDIEVFTRAGCPRCVAAERFLAELLRERPDTRIVFRHVDHDPRALERLRQLAAEQGVRAIGLPAFHLRDRLLIGFSGDEGTGAEITALLAGRAAAGAAGPACPPGDEEPCESAEDVGRVTLPLFGPVALADVGLPLFTLAIGLVDGFNPCAMWVLLFLLSLLVNVRSRARMLLIASIFVLASGVVYFTFMAAWLNVFLLVGFSTTARVVLGLFAVLVGLVHVKDFFAWGRGISFSIPERAKPRLYARARRVVQSHDLAAAAAGVTVLAVLANTVELLCSAGLPALYTHVLAQHDLAWWGYYGYLVLYNVAYMFDDAVMVLVAVVTMSRYKLQERAGRWLKLLSGAVMLALGVVLLLAPEWLSFGLV
jgi:glutaredoxin